MYNLLEEQPFASIFHSATDGIIKVQWQGATTSEQYRTLLTTALEHGIKHDATLFMSDIRKQKSVSPDDRKWFQNVHMPKSIENGLVAAAVITDGGIFKRYYLNHIFNASKKFGLPLKFFTDSESAQNWLTQFH